MHRLRTLLTVIGTITVLILAGNTVALAATGGKFFLGQTNKANKQSTLKRTTSGPALGLTTKSSSNAPLVTNGRGKVGNLNADLIDGKDSTALQTTAYVYTTSVSSPTSELEILVPVPAGRYLVSYSAQLINSLNSQVACVVIRKSASAPATDTYVARSQFNSGNLSPALSGSGYVQKGGDQTIRLICEGAPFTTNPEEPIQIVATRLSAVAGPVALTPQP